MTRSHLILCTVLALPVAAGCSPPTPQYEVGNAQVRGHYDRKTGRLTSITYDSNKDGKIDTWSYMDGARVIRIEIDTDHDGKLDRWEYYTPDQKLEKVGYSRANDGTPDAWAYQGADGKVAKIELAGDHRVGSGLQPGTTRIVRTEFYANGALVRAEDDTNGDGKVDKWETWRDGAIASVAFDSAGRGTPDRRLVYGSGGAVTVEVDPDGTGAWKPAPK